MSRTPDGDLSQLHLQVKGIPIWGMVLIYLSFWCMGGPFFYAGVLWMLHRMTTSPWARWWTMRWWVRALGPMSVAVFGLALFLQQPLMLIPSVAMLLLIPVAFWGFLRGMTRPDSALREQVHGPGMLMNAMLTASAVGVFSSLLYPALLSSTAGFTMLGVSILLLLGAHLCLLLPISQLSQFWTAGAGRSEEHIAAVCAHLRGEGLTVQDSIRSLTAQGSGLTVEMDVLQAPAMITIRYPLDALPSGLRVCARRPEDPPGVSLTDPMLGDLLYIEADDPGEARRLLGGLHEDLLANLHAWPGSVLCEEGLRVEMTGPPFVAPGRVQAKETPNAQHTVAALTAQLDNVRRLAAVLQQRQAKRAEAVRQCSAVRRGTRAPERP